MSGSGARPPHAVLLREPARFDPQTTAVVLASSAGLPAETLLPVVRRGWGSSPSRRAPRTPRRSPRR
ncbi:MAG: hypothetical protein M0D55_08170 [Elusimicrobiota bacterium]|nr:MAG: hypothetical protein M0D55_08170 [Elusimicrobiota bacterium]